MMYDTQKNLKNLKNSNIWLNQQMRMYVLFQLPPPPDHLSMMGRQITMMTLENNVNIMKLGDEDDKPEPTVAAAAMATTGTTDSTSNNTPDSAPKIGGYQYQKLQRDIHVPPEPGENEERILLAVKLPTGQRIQRHFRKTETLELVVQFAELSSQLDFTGHEIVCDAPRKVFKDLSVVLAASGLENRTVVHVQLPDD